MSSADHRPGPQYYANVRPRMGPRRSIRRRLEEGGFTIVRAAGISWVFDPVRRALFGVLSVLTLGFYRDTQFRQFAVLARLWRGEAR